jgi:hypothetical protein
VLDPVLLQVPDLVLTSHLPVPTKMTRASFRVLIDSKFEISANDPADLESTMDAPLLLKKDKNKYLIKLIHHYKSIVP